MTIAEKVQEAGERVKETFAGSADTSHGLWVVKCYQPHPNKEQELENALLTHWNALSSNGLTTGPEAVFAKDKTGHILEIFAFKDEKHAEKVYEIDTLKKTWDTICNISALVPLARTSEANDPYAGFQVICPKTHQNKPHMIQIVTQKPHQGKEQEYEAKLKEHDRALRAQKLSTSRPALHLKDNRGYYVTIDEWETPQKHQEAMQSDKISGLWSEFQQIADSVKLGQLPESKDRYLQLHAIAI